MKTRSENKIITENKKAFYDYEIIEKLEAGIVLHGYEVAAVRRNRVSLTGSYALLHNNELFLINAHISCYQPKNQPADYNPTQSRKLLLTKKEISYLQRETKEKHFSIIPLKIYIKNKKIKVELGLARGKKKYDKREVIKKRTIERNIKKHNW